MYTLDPPFSIAPDAPIIQLDENNSPLLASVQLPDPCKVTGVPSSGPPDGTNTGSWEAAYGVSSSPW